MMYKSLGFSIYRSFGSQSLCSRAWGQKSSQGCMHEGQVARPRICPSPCRIAIPDKLYPSSVQGVQYILTKNTPPLATIKNRSCDCCNSMHNTLQKRHEHMNCLAKKTRGQGTRSLGSARPESYMTFHGMYMSGASCRHRFPRPCCTCRALVSHPGRLERGTPTLRNETAAGTASPHASGALARNDVSLCA